MKITATTSIDELVKYLNKQRYYQAYIDHYRSMPLFLKEIIENTTSVDEYPKQHGKYTTAQTIYRTQVGLLGVRHICKVKGWVEPGHTGIAITEMPYTVLSFFNPELYK